MARPTRKLPRFIVPMLARPGTAFDSPDHLFEIKWDGTRALAFIEGGRCRLVNRRRIDITDRYPDLAFLGDLEPGQVLDGEIVVLRDGRPDFGLLQSREQARSAFKARTASRSFPATYVAFDQLYRGFSSLMDEPLAGRRETLAATLAPLRGRSIVLSDGVVGHGTRFFEEACGRGLEGVVAKRLDSRYLPGKRTDAWIKIKRRSRMHCAIIGFVPAGEDDFRSLILATDEEGELRPAGKVGTGFDARVRARLNELLRARLRPRPIVPCSIRGKWVEPGLYCTVSYLERTARGEFRAPVFEELMVE